MIGQQMTYNWARDTVMWHWSADTLFWQLLIDYKENVHYEVKHRQYMPWTQVMPGQYKKLLPA